jgi:hypothetical protein
MWTTRVLCTSIGSYALDRRRSRASTAAASIRPPQIVPDDPQCTGFGCRFASEASLPPKSHILEVESHLTVYQKNNFELVKPRTTDAVRMPKVEHIMSAFGGFVLTGTVTLVRLSSSLTLVHGQTSAE